MPLLQGLAAFSFVLPPSSSLVWCCRSLPLLLGGAPLSSFFFGLVLPFLFLWWALPFALLFGDGGFVPFFIWVARLPSASFGVVQNALLD